MDYGGFSSMYNLRRRKIIYILAAVALSVASLLAGCGQPVASGSANSGTTTSPPVVTQQPVEQQPATQGSDKPATPGNASTAEPVSSDITKIPLDSVLGKGKPTVADFGWRDCIPCKAIKPILEALAIEYKDRLNVLIVEVYDPVQEKIVVRHNIKSIPTQIFFDKNGKR